MKISIAMATYNGQQYVRQQLQSILHQTKLPDELVVVDDCSSDHTVQLIQHFAALAPFKVILIKNIKNLGHELTFGKALSACTGDLVFLCDQDDFWFPEKIQRMSEVFAKKPHIKLLVCDAHVTDEHLSPSGLSVRSKLKRSLILGRFETGLTLGCATAVKKDLLNFVLPLCFDNGEPFCYGHDTLLHEVAHIFGVRSVFRPVLQYYRRHAEAATVANETVAGSLVNQHHSLLHHFNRTPNLVNEYLKRLRVLETLNARLVSTLQQSKTPFRNDVSTDQLLQNLQRLSIYRSGIVARIRMISATNPFDRRYQAFINYLLGRYLPFHGFKSFVYDLLTS